MKTSLLNYNLPEDLETYMSYYGAHFNKRLYEFATSLMRKEDKASGRMVKVIPPAMEEVKASLATYNVEIEPNHIYDAMYLSAMVKADYWGSSIEDEEHMARYIKDVICDPDGYDGIVFCRFIADCTAKGIAVFWDMMI